jgi:glycosyltransferase involved in cell wall biosynthesis
MSGDLWAGPEVMLHTLLSSMKSEPAVDVSVVLLNEGRLAENLRESGVETLVIEERRHGFIAIRRRLLRHLSGRPVDILHSHRYKENILAALIKSSGSIRHLVQTVHGTHEAFTGLRKVKVSAYSMLNRYFTARDFDKILPVSNEIFNSLVGVYGDERMLTIHNAIDPQLLRITRSPKEVRRELRVEENCPLIGSAGRMVPIKGYDVLLESAKLVLDEEPNARFILAGDGPQKGELERRAQAMGLGGKVLFIGFRHDITDIINSLDLFLMSSYHEGIPMVLLEAMALQKPIVSTAVGGIDEVIASEESGLLVDSGDVRALATACLTVLQNTDMKTRMGVAAKKRIEDEFSVDVQKRRLVAVYRELMSRP